jgi:dihydrofolate reductase
MEIIIIAAMAENRVIGRDNALPWSLKEDMAHFKELTLGWPCIMGRKTWESLPKRPLPGRLNIVVSRTMAAEAAPGTSSSPLVFSSLREALTHCAGTQKVFICGGASLYKEALAFATAIELTLIHKQYAGDVFFPDIDPALWVITATADFDGYSFISYGKPGDIEKNNAKN